MKMLYCSKKKKLTVIERVLDKDLLRAHIRKDKERKSENGRLQKESNAC